MSSLLSNVATYRFIRVFHNTLNYKEKIAALQESLKSRNDPSAMRERQQMQLKALEKSLNKIYLSQQEKQAKQTG